MPIIRLFVCCCAFIPFALKAQCPISVDAGEDIYLCAPPTPTQLNGDVSGPYLGFSWSPTTGMSGSTTLSPTVTVSQTTSYVLTATAPDFGTNLVDNGDFESGNTGFTSDYIYNPGNLVPEGYYDVIDNPQLDHPGFAACHDHTSGSGNMMAVNGAGTPNQNVWCETVNINPNSQYVLSAYVSTLVASSPARLQFSINGITLGPIFNAPGSLCVWQNYFQVWNSGSNTTATICIVNQNTTLGGNDFALDDIVFASVCTVTDTVKVNVVNVTAVAAPPVITIPCEGSSVQLSGVGSSTGPNISYEWTTATGNIVSGANTLTPIVNAPGEYTLTVSYSVNGTEICNKTAHVNVILNPSPLSAWINTPPPLGCGSPTALLVGNSSQPAFSSYQWTTSNGHIVSGSDQKLCTVNQVGTYSLLITNTQTGCTATADVTVSATNNVPVANANSNGIITCAHDSVPLLGAGSSSGASIVYSWTTANGHVAGHTDSLNTFASAGGTYILHVTNTSNNCTTNDTIVVPANTTPPTVVGTLPPQISCDPNQDTISLFINVGPPPFVLINWTTSDGHLVSGQFTPAPQADQPGVYSVSVFDPANGCYNYDTSLVKANFTIPKADILFSDTLTCQSPSVVLQGEGSTTGPNFSINWAAANGGNIVSGGNTLTPTVNAAGDYFLILRDSVSLCADTAMVSVTADTNVVVAIANAPDTLNCLVNLVSLNTNGSSSNGSLSYHWTTTDGHISSGQDTPNPTADTPGTYQLLLTNTANGCSATDLAIVEQNTAPPLISIDIPDTLTCAVASVQIQAQINSTGQFSYHWTSSNGGNITSGDSTLTPTVNQAGNYTILATNLGNGCTSSASIAVTLEAGFPVVAAATPGPLTCVDTSQTLLSAGSSNGAGYQYLWSTVGGHIVSGANGPNPVVDEPGMYTLQITNASNGCASSSTLTVTQDILAPGAAIFTAPDTLTCLLTQLNLQANGTGNAVWSTLGGNILSSNGLSALIDAPGDYILTTTNPANGCISHDSITIPENVQIPTLSLSLPDTLTCTLKNLDILATAGGQNLQYQWQTSGGNILQGQNAANLTLDAPGNYNITVTDGVNGCSISASTTVVQNVNPPALQIGNTPPVTCANQSQTLQAQNLSATGNFSYTWTASNGGHISSGANTLTPVVDAGGDFVLVATNLDNGCSSTLNTSVLQDTNHPQVNAGADDTLSCLTNALTINGSGSGAANLSFSWQAANGGHIVSGNNTASPVVDQPGDYTLTVTNPVNGCSSSDVVLILKDANAPSANAGSAASLTCSVNQVTLNGTGSQGLGISYQWTSGPGGNIQSGQTSLQAVVTKPGVYTLAVTNASNGCVATSTVSVPENKTPPIVNAGADATLTCAITSLSLNGSTGGEPATYAWATGNGHISSGGNTLLPTIDQTGTYTLTVTRTDNGCTANDQVTVNIDTLAPAFLFQNAELLTCVNQQAQIGATVQQPSSGNFNVQWSTNNGHLLSGQTSLSAVADKPGDYLLTVNSLLNGCSAQQSVQVKQDTVAPLAHAAPAGDITCTIKTLALDGSGSATGAQYSYQWTAAAGAQILNGANTLSPTVGSPGAFTLIVTDSHNGCTATALTTVGTDTIAPVAAIATPGQLTCLQKQVNLNGNGSSQGANYSAAWSTANGHFTSGQSTYSAGVDQPGLYTLKITNQENGCSATTQISVQQNISTPGALIVPPQVLHCKQPEIILLGSSPTLGSMSYAWSASNGGNILTGVNTPTPMVDAAGVYQLIVTNLDNGCSSSVSATVMAIPDPEFSPLVNQPDCHHPKGIINFGSVSKGMPPYSYSIDGGQHFDQQSTVSDLLPDDYELVVSDANGCTALETVSVDVPFEATLILDDIQKIDQGDSIQLQPVTNVLPAQIASWEWTPAEHLSCNDCPAPWANPLTSQYYTVTVADKNGCKAVDRILVQVSRIRHIYPPTVFSPNDDGKNDLFTIYAKGVKEIRQLAIFDRWGEELFLRKNFPPNDETLGWDGNFRGTPLNPAVYVWMAELEFSDGSVEVFYGDVTLIR